MSALTTDELRALAEGRDSHADTLIVHAGYHKDAPRAVLPRQLVADLAAEVLALREERERLRGVLLSIVGWLEEPCGPGEQGVALFLARAALSGERQP